MIAVAFHQQLQTHMENQCHQARGKLAIYTVLLWLILLAVNIVHSTLLNKSKLVNSVNCSAHTQTTNIAGEAAADQVMALASAVMREAQAAFAACGSAQPALLPDVILRLRSLLLSSARLSEGELLRRTDDLGPTTAQTAPHRVWRWNLTTDSMPLGTGPGMLCFNCAGAPVCSCICLKQLC